jgi:hypothetical protein
MSNELQKAREDVTTLRTSMRANGRLNLEFKAALSKLFRVHNIPISDAILAKVILAIPEEIDVSSSTVVLPTPSLPPG